MTRTTDPLADDLRRRRRITALEHYTYYGGGVLPDRTLLGPDGDGDAAYERRLGRYIRHRIAGEIALLLAILIALAVATAEFP